ncbi:MAG: DNA translocase FtsK, partial [Akkermansiaceae bacterium]
VRNFDSFNSRELPEKEEPTEEELAAQEAEAEEENYDPEHLDSIAQALTDGELGPPALDGSDDGDEDEEIPDRIPYIVVIIDELADLMQTAPADMEMNIARIAQKARAAGIHLIVATQTPRADVVTGIIKANIPSRIAFQVSSKLDSRVILDVSGADKLVGKGDMLYLPPGSAKLERAQGAFISDEEVEDLVKFCSNQVEQVFEKTVQESIESGGSDDGEEEVSDADEEIVQKCMEVIRQEKKASTSLLQRRLRLGYTRAARMMDILEQRGIIGPGEGAKPREILINVGQDEA